ncbi:WD repeat-containing protein 75 [Tanacetum coccineum]
METFGDQTFAGDNGRLKKEDEKPGVIGDGDVDSRTTRHWHFVEVKFLFFSSNGGNPFYLFMHVAGKGGFVAVWQLDTDKKFLPRIRTSLLRAGQKGRKHEDISVILRTFESKIRPPCPKVSHALEEIDKCITSDDPECVPVRTYESGNPFYLFMHVAGKGGFVAVWQLDTDKKFLPTYETKLVIFYELCLTDVLHISCADNRIHFLKMPSMEILQSISGIKFYSLFDDHESSEVQDCERNHQPSDDVTSACLYSSDDDWHLVWEDLIYISLRLFAVNVSFALEYPRVYKTSARNLYIVNDPMPNLPKLGWGSTILDVGCGVASFGYTGMDMVPAALTNLPLWVMNVVPLNASDTSPVIFDRGLIGQCMGLMRYAHISVHWTEPVGIPEAATK